MRPHRVVVPAGASPANVDCPVSVVVIPDVHRRRLGGRKLRSKSPGGRANRLRSDLHRGRAIQRAVRLSLEIDATRQQRVGCRECRACLLWAKAAIGGEVLGICTRRTPRGRRTWHVEKERRTKSEGLGASQYTPVWRGRSYNRGAGSRTVAPSPAAEVSSSEDGGVAKSLRSEGPLGSGGLGRAGTQRPACGPVIRITPRKMRRRRMANQWPEICGIGGTCARPTADRGECQSGRPPAALRRRDPRTSGRPHGTAVRVLGST